MAGAILDCSCGDSTPHVIARRETLDGVRVEIWHDGAITGRIGRALPGVPIARPRTDQSLMLARKTAALFSGEVELYDVAELPRLYDCARRVAARGGLPGDVRGLYFSCVSMPSTDKPGQRAQRSRR